MRASKYFAGIPSFGRLRSAMLLVVGVFGSQVSNVAHAAAESPVVVEEPPPISFEVPADCVPGNPGQPRALLVGVGSVETLDFQRDGVDNDLRLLGDVLTQKGAEVSVLSDPTLPELVEGIRSLIESTQCGDTVFVHLTGSSALVESWRGAKSGAMSFTGPDAQIVFATPDAGPLTAHTRGADVGLRDIDLANAVAALRNRGAFVLVSLDTVFAGAYELFQQFSESQVWRLSDEASGGPQLARGASGVAVFYAVGADELAFEFRLPLGPDRKAVPGAVPHGPFSYALAGAIASGGPEVSVRELAESMNRTYGEIMQSHDENVAPRYESSDPEHRMLAPDGLEEQQVGQVGESETDLDVLIIAPKLMRGLGISAGERIVLEGRLKDRTGLVSLLIDSRPVPVRRDGYFRAPLNLSPSGTSLTLVGLFADAGGDYSSRVTELPYEFADALSSAAEDGRRFALLIGNQNYSADRAWTSLRTPHDDVDAIAAVLSENYGFETVLDVEGVERSLILKDANRTEILSTLDVLRRHLSENDSLLVFYAGHGYYLEEMDEAYWVPADAGPGELFSLIPAGDITRQLRMMDARHVLIVSDSCYSGGLTRSGANDGIDGPDAGSGRDNYLRALLERRSRALLSSGSNEPVWDGGGGGNHSVFAAALLNGLQEMRFETFTAEELYSDYLKEAVAGSSKQVPQYNFLQNSGHDGGGFLFFGGSE